MGHQNIDSVFEVLCGMGCIGIEHGEIASCGLNVSDFPAVRKFIPQIAQWLHDRIIAADIRYDAFIGVPRGGNAWADELARVATKREKREVRCYRMRKTYVREFVIDTENTPPDGARLLLVDDNLWKGRSSSAAAAALRRIGHEPIGLVFPAQIGTVGRDYWRGRGKPIISLYDTAFVQARRTAESTGDRQ